MTVKLFATNKSPLIETSSVTNKLPPTVALPLADTVDNVVAPVTPNVPPSIVAPFPTVRVLPSATLTFSLNVVAPLTANVPPSVVAPFPTVIVLPAATLTLSFNVVVPATVKLLPSPAIPDVDNVDKVVAPVTAIVPPIFTAFPIPIPPAVCIEPVIVVVESVVDKIFTLLSVDNPVISKLPPIFTSCSTPNPPAVCIAPVKILLEFVLFVTDILPLADILDTVVAPVTPNVVPIVAEPLVDTVVNDVLPIAFNVPYM